jgi:small subunit ribosomal protein S3
MEEKKFIRLKKEEYGIKEYIKRDLGKGKISKLDIEYTPVGEKIIISTSKPGLIIGRRGEKIDELTQVLKTKFKLENPHIEIKEIENPIFDAQLVADEIAMSLEKMGNLKFKVIAYKKLQEIINSGALGCELRLSGKLPSDRAKSWRFAQGYLKKAGESRREVNRAEATALTKLGITGIKVAIMPPNARVYDRIDINQEIKNKIKHPQIEEIDLKKEGIKKKNKKSEEPRNKKERSYEEEDDNEKRLLETNKLIREEPVLKNEEDGTAMLIEEEIEEGVPQEIIDEELNKKTEKNKKGAKLK